MHNRLPVFVTLSKQFVGIPIIGPVANDQTFQTIGLYFRGFITAEMAFQLLLPQNLKDPYCIKTEKALACLVFKEVKRL